jgi:hypothetical protein
VSFTLSNSFRQNTVAFLPEVTVTIWVETQLNNGSVISDVGGKPAVITLTPASPSATFHYDSNLAKFVQDAPAPLARKLHASYRLGKLGLAAEFLITAGTKFTKVKVKRTGFHFETHPDCSC